MAQKDKMESFVHNIYQQNEGRKLSKQDIVSKASSATLAPDVEVFFKELPDRDYDENGLVDELNAVIEQRGRADAIGGKLTLKHM